MSSTDEQARRNGRYPWNQIDNIKIFGVDDIPDSKSIVAARCSDMNEIIHEHHLHATDIPIPFIYETIDTGDIESFIAFCEKKEREASGQTV